MCGRGVSYHDIVLKNLKGENVRLSEYVKPGAYNMLEFWASWCSPCRGEIPHLRHLYEVCGKDFNMISVSIDERDTDWKKAVQEEGMQWHQLCDQKGRKGPGCDRISGEWSSLLYRARPGREDRMRRGKGG